MYRNKHDKIILYKLATKVNDNDKISSAHFVMNYL